MRLLSMILRLLGRLLKSFVILLSIVFIGIPLGILMRIFPPLRRKIESLNQSFLSGLVYQPSQGVTLDIEIPNQQDYLNFLMETLQKVSGNPNSQVIYPFWEENLDKLDDNLARLLDSWARETLTQTTREETYPLAMVIFNNSHLIQEFPLGNIAANKEIAIAGYRNSLNIFTYNDFPPLWAMGQIRLGNAYSDRIGGDKADNLETAITYYQEALKVYTINGFRYEWAMTKYSLGNGYCERIRGDKADNLETAITYYQEALKVYTINGFRYEWAMTQNSLGTTYFDRIRGDKAKNLEQAIAYYQEALKVRTLNACPKEWAMTQNNLGTAYLNRIRGDKADNLETAIAAFNEALTVRTFEEFPQDWAVTQNGLATAYLNRITGDKADNLEKALTTYKKALTVFTFNTFPQQWAMTQNNLGIAYLNRIRGDKADNLENAIAALTEALKVRTFEAFPQDWAMTQDNLGTAYIYRIRGDKADNLETAINTLRKTLKVFTFEAFPQDWAMTQMSLGIACLNRIRGDKADNLENAITALTEALKVLTFDAFPYEWANTQMNLGNVYFKRIKEDKADNLENAITAYNEVLKVRKLDAFSLEWAATQDNLGNVYYDRIRGDKAENIKNAITSYQNALTIRTKENDPLNCLKTTRNLAILHYKEKQWQPATEAYHIAIEVVENARLEALDPQARQEVLSNAIDVFHRIVQAHLHLNQPEKALEYVERSKGRNLVELMTQKNLQPQGVGLGIIAQLNELKQRVVSEQIRLQSQSINQNLRRSYNLNSYVQDHSYLKKYQQELDDFIEKEIKPIDPSFSITQKVEPIPFADIQALTDSETCLLQWYIIREKILAFVVSAGGEVKVWQSSEDDVKQLVDGIANYLQLYYSKNGKAEWRNQLSSLLQTFANRLHINDILTLIPDTCKRLIIIPHWFLHILPLHALPVSNSHFLKRGWEGTELHDLFPNGVQYAPSCQLLKIAQSFHHAEFNKLFVIQNPTKDLLFTDLEVNILSTFFTESKIIAKDNATKNAVLPHLKSSNNHCHHFSCHGGFNPANPLESALFLANQDPLTLGEIFELRLNQCRLVTLSACETGLIDLKSISDEYIGLPSGFLFAGSPSVVSSLWTVNDLSTSFLMIKFYEILFNPNLNISVAVALKQAQNWLQNLTVKEAEENLESQTFQRALIRLQQTLSSGDLFELEDAIALLQTKWKTMSPEDKPFNNPFYWAGFVASGV